MLKPASKVQLRNLPPTLHRFEGAKGNIEYGLRERDFKAWGDDYLPLMSYVVELYHGGEYRELRVPAVCTYLID